jgi:hypothetical protein
MSLTILGFQAVIIEIDNFTATILLAAFFVWGLLMGYLIGKRRSDKNDLKLPKDSGLLFLQALTEQGIPDSQKLEVSTIKSWILKVQS